MGEVCRPVNATMSLVDPLKKTGENAFEITAKSWQGLIDLTLSDDSTYAAVSIDAQATDAPVHLSLDPAFEGTFTAKTIKPDASERATVAYTHGGLYSGLSRVFQTPFRTRHLHTGAAGWGSEEAAANGPSFAEIRSIHRSAHIDI